MSDYNMHIERLDGTLVDGTESLGIKYPSQLNDHAAKLAKHSIDPQVFVTVWKHNKGEVRKKFYSGPCWGIETFALEMFDQMCKEHDWYYEYSDDHRVWQKGKDAYSTLWTRYGIMKQKYPAATQAIWETYNPFLKSQKE
jgi:hypothetical protein